MIFESGLAAVEPRAAVRRHVSLSGNVLILGTIDTPGGRREIDLAMIDRICVVGAGKASAAMAEALEQLLADRITGGLIVVKDGCEVPLRRIQVLPAGHPVPDERGAAAAKAIVKLLEATDRRSLVLCLISGGASALLAAPAPGIELTDKQAATRMLLSCGAAIDEVNTVRKHLSRVKGGQLARLAYPSPVVSLILSDVVGDGLDVIGSGPTVPDPTTFGDARDVLAAYGLWEEVAPSIRRHISDGLDGSVRETPKPGDPVFFHCRELLVGTNLLAVTAAAAAARRLGYTPLVLSTRTEGEAREVARVLAAVAREVRATSHPLAPPACILMGGETTVTLRADGKGGRNQEFALAAALAIDGADRVVVLAGGTDGSDGPTDAAGAVADPVTCRRAADLGLDPRVSLRRNDAYHFFEPLEDLLITGPTRTNVMDIYLALVG